ncbi:hypothetical protein JVU11DRAFT_8628 [Chiua virens]|nr:hypothetical protein JVU11DRAFT_8628 [Chiua virens]
MSVSSMRSPRPSSVASYQSSSPRLPSPLNPSPNPFSPSLRDSPVGEMSDTLSSLRECLEPGLTSPRPSSGVTRPRASYARHPSPISSPFTQGIPFSTSSPRPSSPLVGPSQSPGSHSPRPISPSNGPMQGSPASIHSIHSHSQSHLLRSPYHPNQPHFLPPQSSPLQAIPSPSHYTRTQSLIQQSFGSPYTAQVVTSSPPDSHRCRHISLSAESRPHTARGSPTLVGHSSVQDAQSAVKGDSTPLNEAPHRWWGGLGAWVEDWDNAVEQSRATCDLCAAYITGGEDLDGVTRSLQPGHGTLSSRLESFDRSGGGASAFLDEEIRASFDGAVGVDAGYTDPPEPKFIHIPLNTNTSYEVEGIPVPRTAPVPIPPPVNESFGIQNISDDLMRRRIVSHPLARKREYLYSVRSLTVTDSVTSIFTDAIVDLVMRLRILPVTIVPVDPVPVTHEHFPSLSSLGIGIEKAEREELRSRTFWAQPRKNSGSAVRRQSKGLVHGSRGHSDDFGHGRQRSVGAGQREQWVGGDADSRPVGAHAQEKDTVKHGSMFFRASPKQVDVLDEQLHRERHERTEKCVSLAITSILPAATITRLSPVGEALIKVRESVKYVGHELAPVVKETLSVSTDLLSFAPLPGIEEAAKALLNVWNACQKVDAWRPRWPLTEPVEKLCGALAQIQTFLEMQLHRPFLKRYFEIRDLCPNTHVSRGVFDDEGVEADPPKRPGKDEVVAGFSSGNALGLTTDATPPLAYGPPSQLQSTTSRSISTEPTSSILSIGHTPDEMGANASALPTPTPTRTTFAAEATKTQITRATTTTTEAEPSHAILPMHVLAQVHRAQDSEDAAADEAALRGTLVGALNAHDDLEMVRCLQGAEVEMGKEVPVTSDKADVRNPELDRKFMQSGIEAMTRLTNVVAKKSGNEEARPSKSADAFSAPKLPSWTITRYEVTRTRKIGTGFFSDTYLGRWKKIPVFIKVLAHGVSRDAFVRHVELWNALDHPNVLPLCGASSTMGDKPWFFVSKFCSGRDLAAALKHARMKGTMTVGKEAVVGVDLLRSIHEIAKGMMYLHGRGILHGDLRAANVLVDESGKCVLSGFGESEIKLEGASILWTARAASDSMMCTAFAICCVEILGLGNLPWATLDDRTIQELVLDKDERPPIPVLAGNAEVTNIITNLVHSCWGREPDRRPSFATIVSLLKDVCMLQDHHSSRFWKVSTPPPMNTRSTLFTTPTESSPADELYETAPESMTTEAEEGSMDSMMDVSLTSPIPTLHNGEVVRSLVQVTTSASAVDIKVPQQAFCVPELQDRDTPTTFLPTALVVDMRNEENYRSIVGSNHVFHSSLTLPLWSPTRVELGAVGYLSKSKGQFITLLNAIDPLQSCEESLRRLPSLYGYGKFEIQRREDGKRSVAQRGLDAISGFLTFKTRGDRSYP